MRPCRPDHQAWSTAGFPGSNSVLSPITDNPFKDAPEVTEDPWAATDAAGPQPQPTTAAGGTPIPWEHTRSLSALIRTVIAILTAPRATFSGAKEATSLWPALAFVAIMGTASRWLGSLADFVWIRLTLGDTVAENFTSAWVGGIGRWLALAPVRVVMMAFIGAGLMHLALVITGAAKRDFAASFRIVAYASGAMVVFSVIPMLGGWLTSLGIALLEIVAIRQVHQASTGKAAFAAIAPLVILYLWSFGALMLGISALGGLFGL